MDRLVPKILIVDDDLNMTGTVRDILEERGFNPILASNQAQVLAQIGEHQIEVALIDLRLGKESGLDVLREIKIRHPETECILLTGFATQTSAIEAIQLGAFGYFQKPIDMDQLLLSIQRAVEKHDDRETLRKNEARFHALTQNAADLIVVISADGIIQYVSPSINRILGYTEPECLGRNFLEWVYPEDHPRALEALISRSNKTGTAENPLQIRGLHKDGSWRVIEVLGTNLLAEPAIQGIVMNMRDITERKASEENLIKNESLLSEAQRIGKIGHWEWAAPASNLTCSGEFLRIFELPNDGTPIKQDTIANMVGPEDRTRLTSMDMQAFAKRGNLDYEFQIYLPSNRMAWIHQQVNITYGSDGQPLRMIGVIQDITERKKADEALLKSEAQYKLLANNISDVIWILDLETGRFNYVSPSVEQLRGYTVNEVLSQSASESLTPGSFASVQKNISLRLVEAKQGDLIAYSDEVEQPCKDGTTVWTETTTRYHFNPESGHWEVYGVSRNINERKATDKALREKEERYRLLFESAPVGIFSATLEGQIVEINSAALQILGSPSVEATKSINLLTFPLLVQSGFSANFKACVQSGRSVFAEQSYTSMWGKSVYIQYRMTPISDPSGQVSLVQIIMEDITERKYAEEALYQSEKRYRGLFEDSPIAIWEEDFSEVKKYLDSLKQQGITDFRNYFELHPDVAFDCSTKIKVLDVNNSAVQMFGAESKEILINNTTSGQSKGEAEHNYEDFVAISEGKISNSWEGMDETVAGEPIEISLSWSVVPGYEDDFSKVIVTTLNISERKQAEEALRDREASLQAVLQSTADGILAVSSENKVLYTNEHFAEMWKISQTLLASRDDSILLQYILDQLLEPQVFLQKVQELYKSDRESFDTLYFKDGRVFERFSHPMREGTNLRGRVWSFRNVTERKQAEEALRMSEANLTRAQSIAHIGSWNMDVIDNILTWSVETYRIFGVPLETPLTYESFLAYVHPDDVDLVNRSWEAALQGSPYDVEHRILVNGQVKWVRECAELEADENGHILRGIGTVQDITERKQAEEQLILQSSALNAAANTIVITDRDAIIRWANPAFSKLTGYALNEALGKNPRDLIRSGKQNSAFYKKLWDTILEGEVWQGELINRRKDGTFYNEELTITPVRGAAGNVDHFVAIKQDITERKQVEDTTREQAKQLQLLYETSQRLNRTLDIKDVYQAVCDFMSSITRIDGLFISAFDAETQLITCRAYWLDNKWLDVSDFPAVPLEEEGKGTQSRAIRSGNPMLINDFEAYQKTASLIYYVDSETNKIAEDVTPPDEDVTRSAMIVPLKKGDAVTGVIQVVSNRLNAYTEQQLKLLESLALHIVSAEQNAILYTQTQIELNERKIANESVQQHLTELELLYESGLAFSQMLSPKEIGQKILELLNEKMDWHHTTIRLLNPTDGSMELIAFHQEGMLSESEKQSALRSFSTLIANVGDGLTGWAIRQSRTIRIGDVIKEPHYKETVPGIRSGLYVPVKLGERVVGAISIESEEENAFSETDERLVNTLANQAANAFENARLFDETKQRITELTTLHQAGQTLLAARLNPEDIYEAVHQAVLKTMPCDAFVIVLDDEDGEYHAVYFMDRGERFPVRRLPRGSGLSGRVIESGETLLIEDVSQTTLQATHFGSMDVSRSILAVPLRRGNKIVGMLSTQSYQPRVFGEPQRVLLETVGTQLSSALDNAHLYRQTEMRIKELETLHVISTSLRSIQDTDEALSVLLDNILAILDTDAGSIMLYDPANDELQDRVAKGWFLELTGMGVKAGEGVAGTVFARGEAYHSLEFIRDSLPHASSRMHIPAGWGGVCLPIHASTGIIGVMFAAVQLPRQINTQQIKLLESLMEMAGTAIQRMRLNNETARRAEEFASLYETSRALSAEYDLSALLSVIVEYTKKMLNASTGAMYLYDQKTQELVLTVDTSDNSIIGTRLQGGEGVAGIVAQTRQPFRLQDYSTWEGRSLKYENISIHAVIEVPMLYGGELIGVLTADETGTSNRKFTEGDERLLSLFASQAAGAINAARHHEETVRHALELEQRVLERTAEIETTRQRLDLAASAGGIGVWELTLTNNKVFWDARMFLIHGVHPTDFDNSLDSWWKMIHAQDMPSTIKNFETALQQTGLFTDEHRIILPDSSVRFITANAIVLYDADHRPERMVGVNVDVTDRKQVEEALQHANYEMERALRTKDEFLATMSHELRTPLNAILGISESLEEQMSGPLNEKQLKYTGIIRESGRHLLELINDILDISKIEAGRMELDVQNISVERVCQSSLRLIRELAQKKNLSVGYEIKGDVKVIQGDERRLKQSLVNLLGNAVKFTPSGSSIGLEVNGYADENEVTFVVWDKGIGIEEADIPLLFKPFVQLDAGLSREYQGTGLGLALVDKMIGLHGGNVRVESVAGEGSRFIITLPWMPEQQQAEAKKATGKLLLHNLKLGGKRGGKILLVEDTDANVVFMSEYLFQKGYEVLIAQDGFAGVQLAKQEHPDLILMDIMMPVMDGFEAAKQIRKEASLHSTPIIAMTALAMPGDRERCLSAGMNHYMSKPIDMQELSIMILNYLGHDESAENGNKN